MIALLLAQVCWLEASFAFDDCTGIVYVLDRRAQRAGVELAEMAVRYSAIDANTERAVFARSLPNGDDPRWDEATNRRWRALRSHAAHALAGRVLNPCPRATHWGARNLPREAKRAIDAVQAGRWRVVRCQRQTANAFYREARR